MREFPSILASSEPPSVAQIIVGLAILIPAGIGFRYLLHWSRRRNATRKVREQKTIELIPEGVRVTSIEYGQTGAFTWADVDEIVAFKRDAFAVDVICMAFSIRSQMEEVEVQ